MAAPVDCVKHLESYVDSSSSPAQQAASLDAITNLMKKDMLTLESLVKEMKMYLTTTDGIIRARGTLLLAEVLERLVAKPLDHATIHTLIGFFSDRLADWRALRGALVGCLALMRRKGNVGVVTFSEAHEVCQASLQNLQVQSLGQQERKLCFELIDCLLDCYPDAVTELGDSLVYGVCESMDGETDPQCLILAFHIVEGLARVFPDSSGTMGSFAEELFGILGSYFPIHFTHPKDDEVDVKRDELSRALMLAFASTPLFEPYAIPLLLEKLSSSLRSTKVESLKYLKYCTDKYGADRMNKHIEALWPSVMDAIRSSSLESDPENDMWLHKSDLATEALTLLRSIIIKDNDEFLKLILCDKEIKSIISSIATFKDYDHVPLEYKRRVLVACLILTNSAKASIAACNRVFESFFPRMVDTLVFSTGHNFGALYMCVELVAACRYLVVGGDGLTSTVVSPQEIWCCHLDKRCSSLVKVFGSTLLTSMGKGAKNAYVYCAVRGLQILATFPGSFSPVSRNTFESILMQLMLIITSYFNETSSWKLVLKSLVEIGIFIDTSDESEKAASFSGIVLEKTVSLLHDEDCTMPLSLRVEAFSEIGMTSKDLRLAVVRGLDDAIHTNLSKGHGDLKSTESAVQLLECYTCKVLPWFQENGGFEEVAFPFAVNIWDQISNSSFFTFSFQQKKLVDTTMRAIRLAVGGCSEENQSTLLKKAFSILSSSTSTQVTDIIHGTIPVEMEGSQKSHELGFFTSRDKGIISLFASVIIALRPQTKIANVQVLVQLFLTALIHGHVPSAQALGSLVNKLPLKASGVNISNDFTLEEAIDIIFNSRVMKSCSDGSETGLSGLGLRAVDASLIQIHSINGLAWVGKGLLMRGHEKLKDVIMIFLSFLTSNGNIGALRSNQDLLKEFKEYEVVPVMKSAAEAFHTLMSDSEECLDKRFNAIIRPLYKQRFFNTVIPLLLSSLGKSDAPITRSVLYRAFAHVISNTPLSAILSEAKKLIPIILDALPVLSEDIPDKDIVYSVLLVLSGVLMDKNGKEVVIENVSRIIKRLIELISYSHMMLIRETAIQCLIAMSELPHATIYPMRKQVLSAISKALDDPKRAVRQESVRCQQAWASMAS